eukprot:jgi/Picre1/30817/NNA_006177.t1
MKYYSGSWVNKVWISSKSFPLVSGTLEKTHHMPPQVIRKMAKKVPLAPKTTTDVKNTWQTIKLVIQLKKLAMPMQNPLTSCLKISEQMIHGIGPNPGENARRYAHVRRNMDAE